MCGFMQYKVGIDSLHVKQLVVASEAYRTGVGFEMVSRLIDEMAKTDNQINQITVEVPETNEVARKFFFSCGFRAIKTIPDSCNLSGETEVVYLMRLELKDLEYLRNSE